MTDTSSGHADNDRPATREPPSCSNCVYYFANKDGKTGSCRRRAPVPVLVGMMQALGGTKPAVDGYFPPVMPNIVCGDHPGYTDFVLAVIRARQEAAALEGDAAGQA